MLGEKSEVSPSDTGMCPHNNFPNTCEQCKAGQSETGETERRELTPEEEAEKDEYIAALGPALVENQTELEKLLADEEGNAERISELRDNIEILEIQIAEAD